ncbi:MAG: TraM recognition domain-containing protein [Bacteroidetes bacterium]|nr:TraM recognition domain-containing protein [Bacteroidota bacterium]
MASLFDLDNKLLGLSVNGASTDWTIRNAVEGVQIFGGIGSGKTSGSGRTLALKYLAAGFGGLVLTVKPDEREEWEKYCRLAGREQDLIVVSPGGKNFFNFLEYESRGQSDDISITENIVQVLKTVIRASEEKAAGKSEDPFWETALDMLMSNIIDLCLLAKGSVSVQQLYEIAQAVPQKGKTTNGKAFTELYALAKQIVNDKVEAWRKGMPPEQRAAIEKSGNIEAAIYNGVTDARRFMFVNQFFAETYLNLSEKTRSVIDFTFSGFLFSLLREPVYSLFCHHPSTFTPKDCRAGKIILIDLPVKLYHKAGRDCQVLFKYIWQRAMEKGKDNERPVFLWADEAQNFLHEYDAEYQATARSSRIATVYISQNLPNYYANMGGAKSEYRVKSFLGTLGTKIFHANADIETNKYASELIGDAQFEETSTTHTAAGTFSASETKSLKIDRAVRPEEFGRLKTGGASNKFCVDGYVHVQGKTLSNNSNHALIHFDQNFSPKT